MSVAPKEQREYSDAAVLKALRELADDEWVSATDLARIAGVTHNLVHYSLVRIKSAGFGLRERELFWKDSGRRVKKRNVYRIEAKLEVKLWPQWMSGSFGLSVSTAGCVRFEEVG